MGFKIIETITAGEPSENSTEYMVPTRDGVEPATDVCHEGVHALAEAESTGERHLAWVHDPADPVPSAVDMEALWYFCAAYPDKRAFAERKDELTFRTEPLADYLDFAGQPMFTGDIFFSGDVQHKVSTTQGRHLGGPSGATLELLTIEVSEEGLPE